MHEAKTKLSKLVARAQAGEEIVIARNGTPVARLVAVEEQSAGMASIRGAWKGRVRIADDFDEPIEGEFADAFGWR